MPTPPASRRPAARPSLRRRVALLVVTALALSTVGFAAPASAAAATPDEVGARILERINGDRAARGLIPYRTWTALQDMAAGRAARLAAAMVLSHSVAGPDIGDTLTTTGLPWYGYGEIIGMTGFPWGTESADDLYRRWYESSAHNAIMFSDHYNYVGVGVVRADDGSTWASVVMAESPDHTAPVARNGSLRRSGRTLYFSWSGRDPLLQAHTAGIGWYDVQVRRDAGSWRTIRNDTTATSLKLPDRLRGHWYAFRVRAADRRGNLSRWTSLTRIWVP
jgi:uncharacterized protein YkwD